MHLHRIEVSHFRNLSSVSLIPAIGLNILEGRNASGKTSFLEALYMLGLVRSFRTVKAGQAIQHNADHLLLFAELSGETSARLGLQRFSDNRTLLRLNGETINSRTPLIHLLPLQLITPDSLSLLSGAPEERRRYLDWMMFHVEPQFHDIWRHYQRSLKQRNALLRTGRSGELPFWSSGLAEHGARIDALRRQTLQHLAPHLDYYIDKLLPGNKVETRYKQGWKSGKSLNDALDTQLDTDLKQRFTSVGPHRADILFTTERERVADILSRGQLKLLLCALKLAQLSYIREETGKSSVVLIDDLPAELDTDHRALLLHLLHDLRTQVFVTSTDRSLLDYSGWDDVKVFHVEHGKIKEVV